VLPPGAGVAVVAPPVGGVGYTIGPFIVSTMVLISGNFTPWQVPWKSSVSMDHTMAPKMPLEAAYSAY